MATDLVLEDEPGERGDPLATRLGIPGGLFNFGNVMEAAVRAALSATPDAQNRPWVPLGARNVGGRVRVLVQHPTMPSRLYAGLGLGGLWRTEDGGDSWIPCGLPEDSFPVGCVAIAPSDPDVVYVGTGEPVNQNNQPAKYPAGIGIVRYSRASDRFTVESNSRTRSEALATNYSRICIDPREANRYWIGSSAGLWRRHPDGSFHVEEIPTLTRPYVVSDVALVPRAAGDADSFYLYAAVATKGIFRATYTRAATGEPALAGWLALGTLGASPPSGAVALPTGAAAIDRIRLAWCESIPNVVYALFEDMRPNAIRTFLADGVTVDNPGGPVPNGSGIKMFRSDDAGDNWLACIDPEPTATKALHPGPPPHGFYAWWTMTMAVHPRVSDLIVTGALDLYRDTSGGRSTAAQVKIMSADKFSQGDRGQHADIHEIFFDRFDPFKLWYACDNGIAIAPDVVHENPLETPLRKFMWRRRSHDLLVSQFNDITVNPQFTQMIIGGLQDNGTQMGIGGGTWYSVGPGDGGDSCFEVGRPRRRFATIQRSSWSLRPGVVVSDAAQAPGVGRMILSPTTPEHAPAAGAAATEWDILSNSPVDSLFSPVIVHHPSLARHLLYGGIGGGGVSTDGTATWTPFRMALTALPALPPDLAGDVPPLDAAAVVALTYAPAGAADTEWWAGSSSGDVFSTRDANGSNWINRKPAWFAVTGSPGPYVSRIVVHPQNRNYVVVCTGGHAISIRSRPPTGPTETRALRQIFLTRNRGGGDAAAGATTGDWRDISGDAAVNGGGSGTLRPLPPAPITGAAFDPSLPATGPQTLYVGTLAGVFVIRNLPPATPGGSASSLAGSAIPGFNPEWFSFNNGAAAARGGRLPLMLVNDVTTVTIPGDGSGLRHKLRIATFGRGLYECDLGAPVADAASRFRLCIRQHSIEDGWSYPRRDPTTEMNAALSPPHRWHGDPRYPEIGEPGAVEFDEARAYDIRVDSGSTAGSGPAELLFFEERVDGVEFDEEVGVKPLIPGEKNFVYVQIHNRGWDTLPRAKVHLYFNVSTAAFAPDALTFQPFPTFSPAADALPATFWHPPAFDPASSSWRRIGAGPEIVTNLPPGRPFVVRVEWIPPADVAEKNVVILALVDGGTDDPPPVTAPTSVAALIRDVRHAALRVVPCLRLAPSIYVRDGHEDRGVGPGIAFAGRSPDIAVLQPPLPGSMRDALKDLADQRRGDHLVGDVVNTIVVRVHNAKPIEVAVTVQLWWVKPATSFDEATWRTGDFIGTGAATIPASDWEVATFTWDRPDDPDPGDGDRYRAYVLVALVTAVPPGDPLPVKAEVDNSIDDMWHFFRSQREAGNATLRGVRWTEH